MVQLEMHPRFLPNLLWGLNKRKGSDLLIHFNCHENSQRSISFETDFMLNDLTLAFCELDLTHLCF